jgi:hypothetical protein
VPAEMSCVTDEIDRKGGGLHQSLRSISDVLFTLLNFSFTVIMKKD